jgi:hypothetical protein
VEQTIKRIAETIFAKIRVRIIENTWFDLQQAQKAKHTTFREMTEKYLQSYEKKP